MDVGLVSMTLIFSSSCVLNVVQSSVHCVIFAAELQTLSATFLAIEINYKEMLTAL